MKIAAITCMMAVPFILTVMPNGSTNDAISSLTPNSSVVVLVFNGRVAALDEVEKPTSATFEILPINFLALKPVVSLTIIP